MHEPGDRPASNCPHGPVRAVSTGPHRAFVREQPGALSTLWRLSGRRSLWFVAGYAAAVLTVTATAAALVDLLRGAWG